MKTKKKYHRLFHQGKPVKGHFAYFFTHDQYGIILKALDLTRSSLLINVTFSLQLPSQLLKLREINKSNVRFRASNDVISCCRLAAYGGRIFQKTWRTCSTIIFPYSSNQILNSTITPQMKNLIGWFDRYRRQNEKCTCRACKKNHRFCSLNMQIWGFFFRFCGNCVNSKRQVIMKSMLGKLCRVKQIWKEIY